MREVNHLENISLEGLKELAKTKEPLSYAKMCVRLQIEQKTGTGKETQLRQLKQYCDYEITRSPTRYVITKFKKQEVAKQKESFSPKRKGMLFALVEEMVFSLLEENESLFFSRRTLLEKLGMVNENFKFAMDGVNRFFLASKLNYSVKDMDLFMDAMLTKVLYPSVNRILRTLHNEAKLIKNIGYMYKIANGPFLAVSADSELGRTFLEIEEQASRDLHVSVGYMPNYLTRQKFTGHCKELLQKQHPEMEFFVRCVHLVSTKKIAHRVAKDAQKRLNEIVVQKCLTTMTLDELTGVVRRKLISDLIEACPRIDYEKILQEKECCNSKTY